MGYRPLPNTTNIYCKPIGYSMVVFKIKELNISRAFYNKQDEYSIWSSKDIPLDATIKDIEDYVKTFEAYELHNGLTCGASHPFNWTTAEEEFSDLL